jgi:ubiquinone/menaquinone biosynthesis C-methylase UbiE
MSQTAVFWQTEADAWYRRMQVNYTDEERVAFDPVLRTLALVPLRPHNVLEVGAANGYRLHAIREKYASHCTAVDPSQQAVADGRRRYPDVRFLRGIADRMPDLADGEFDLVIVHSVLSWVDRSRLLRSVAEVDRVLSDGGFLIVGDFYPAAPERVRYHHRPEEEIWTFKQDYPSIWLASGMYEMVSDLALDHTTMQVNATVESQHRFRVCLLRKTLSGRYTTVKLA